MFLASKHPALFPMDAHEASRGVDVHNTSATGPPRRAGSSAYLSNRPLLSRVFLRSHGHHRSRLRGLGGAASIPADAAAVAATTLGLSGRRGIARSSGGTRRGRRQTLPLSFCRTVSPALLGELVVNARGPLTLCPAFPRFARALPAAALLLFLPPLFFFRPARLALFPSTAAAARVIHVGFAHRPRRRRPLRPSLLSRVTDRTVWYFVGGGKA